MVTSQQGALSHWDRECLQGEGQARPLIRMRGCALPSAPPGHSQQCFFDQTKDIYNPPLLFGGRKLFQFYWWSSANITMSIWFGRNFVPPAGLSPPPFPGSSTASVAAPSSPVSWSCPAWIQIEIELVVGWWPGFSRPCRHELFLTRICQAHLPIKLCLGGWLPFRQIPRWKFHCRNCSCLQQSSRLAPGHKVEKGNCESSQLCHLKLEKSQLRQKCEGTHAHALMPYAYCRQTDIIL